MSMLLYIPWCRIDRTYTVGEIAILPFERETRPDDIDNDTWSRMSAILATHRDIKGNPVDRAALVRFVGKGVMDDLTDDEIDTAGDLIAIACFAGVASREYFKSHSRYCNSDCFTFHLQRYDGSESTAISTRRRDGRALSGWLLQDVSVSVPVHCHSIKDVVLDQSLLTALVKHRDSMDESEWGRWQNAVTCFNQANSDSDSFREHIEWVLLCSAFEHLLEAKPSKAKVVARLFDEVVVPVRVVPAGSAVRSTPDQKAKEMSLRYEWMLEFYRVRGDFAHGKLVSRQPMRWKSHEHLILATIAFSLVVKSLLSKAGTYQLTEEDTVQIDCFESLADTPRFFNPPADAQSSWDSIWARLREKRRDDISSEKFMSHCMKALAAQEQGENDQSEETE